MAVATELGTGHEVWLNKGSLVNALKASFALPGIFRPVQINGRWLIDGALVNPDSGLGLPRARRAHRHRRQSEQRRVQQGQP